MNEPVREALEILKQKVYEQNGTKIESCLFVALGSENGDRNVPLVTMSLENIPKELDSTRHDLHILDHVLDLIRNRESIRCGRGPLLDFRN